VGERPGCPPAGPPAVGLGIRGAAPRSLAATVPEYGSDALVTELEDQQLDLGASHVGLGRHGKRWGR
jgi:hypothetical protein